MTQKRSHQWLDDDLTRLMNQKFVGMMEPGVYRGFDVQGSLPASLILSLSHGGPTNGATESTYDDPPATLSNIGVLLTRQGVVVKEDAAVTVVIAANGSAFPRIDLVVCRSKYVELSGGIPTDYAVYTGTPSATPSAPALGLPAQEIAIGTVYMPAGADNLADPGVSWTKFPPPAFANQFKTMFTDREQTSTEMKTFEEIGVVKGAAILEGSDTIRADSQNPLTLVWTEANATFLTLPLAVPTPCVITRIKLRKSLNRVIMLTVTGMGDSPFQLNSNNFTGPLYPHNPAWDQPAVSSNYLRLYEGDVVALLGKNSDGTLWDILWVHSGKNARTDRRLTMGHSVILNKGGVLEDAGGGSIYADWKANFIQVDCPGDRTINTINPAGYSPGGSLVQENLLPPWYEITVIPRYTGATPAVHKFTLGTGGNILTMAQQSMVLPWNRPFTLVAVPSPGPTDDCKWMVKPGTMGGYMQELLSYASTKANFTLIGGAGTFDVNSGTVWAKIVGNTCEMSINLVFETTGIVTFVGIAPPPGVQIRNNGTSNKVLAGMGTATSSDGTVSHLWADYGNSGSGNWLQLASRNDGGVISWGETGTIRLVASFDVIPTF